MHEHHMKHVCVSKTVGTCNMHYAAWNVSFLNFEAQNVGHLLYLLVLSIFPILVAILAVTRIGDNVLSVEVQTHAITQHFTPLAHHTVLIAPLAMARK